MSAPALSGASTPAPAPAPAPPSASASASASTSVPPPPAAASAQANPPPSGPAPPKRIPVPTGIYPVESIKTISESIGINKLDDTVAVALAGDVEFRIHQVIEEAQKFMRHSRRSTMLPCDINHALQALNIEPLYGHLPLPSSSGQPTFVPLRTPGSTAALGSTSSSSTRSNNFLAPSSIDQFYYLQDQEISFDQLLKTKPPGLVGGGVRWTAHWLAVEGVMPRVPENVAMDYHKVHLEAKEAGGAAGGAAKGAGGAGAAAALGGAGPKLSQELQLYFTRLTKALLPVGGEVAAGAGGAGKDGELSSVERARLAALASLRGDTGLQGLVVYLVRWIGEKITESLHHLSDLPPLLDTIHALLSNQTLFLEPYLHQLLPPLLSPLLTFPLGSSSNPTLNGASSSKSNSSEPTASEIRQLAAQVLGVLVNEFGSVYESLIPRLTKTLLRSLAPPNPSGRVEGALLGLGAIGKEGVRRGLWGDLPLLSRGGDLEAGGRGVRSWGESWEREESWSEMEKESVVKAGVSTLRLLLPSSTRPPSTPSLDQITDPATLSDLQTAFGYSFANELSKDRWLAEGLLGVLLGRDSNANALASSSMSFENAFLGGGDVEGGGFEFDFGGEGEGEMGGVEVEVEQSGMVAAEEGEGAGEHKEEEQEDLFVSGPPVSVPEDDVFGGTGGEEGEGEGGDATSFIPGLGEALGIQGMGDGEEGGGEGGGEGGEGREQEGEGGESGSGVPVVVEEDEDADMEEVS
ncbi:hypothetical protein BDY24DRAFT_439665 [Mrakia frigida]|uniref:TATA-binding protein-associated factor TAF6 n=1 Tax=Mrakia frigida TaxID=29902 RepID=UPI003FCBFD56